MRLAESELACVLDAVGTLNSDIDPTSLPARTDAAVRKVVPAEIVSFEGFGNDNFYRGPLWFTPEASVNTDLLSVMGQLVHTHPIIADTGFESLGPSTRVTDHISQREFTSTAIYNEFFLPVGTDMQLVTKLLIHPELWITVSLCRSARDFSDTDCIKMDLLRPHLEHAFQAAHFISRLEFEASHFEAIAATAKHGLVTLAPDMTVHFVNPAASKLFQQYYPDDSQLPPGEVRRYVLRCSRRATLGEFHMPPEPLRKKGPYGCLEIGLTVHPQTAISILLVIETKAARKLIDRGLTERQHSVLAWLSRGKTDGEIGEILGISARTVQKHVEHIFDKLGVETRTSACSAYFADDRHGRPE